MAGWLKIASFVVTSGVATAVAIVAIVAEYRRREYNEQRLQIYEETRSRGVPQAVRCPNQGSQDSTGKANELSQESERKKCEERERLSKLREERIRQFKEDQKRRKEQEKERKKAEKKKFMLESFDHVFDKEFGVSTKVEHVDQDFDVWSRNVQKQKLKEEFRTKQLAQQQRRQD